MESALDKILAPSVQRKIEENLGEKTLEKVKHRLFERYGINLTQAIKDFQKFDNVLREFFGQGAEGLETKLLRNVIETEKSKDNVKIGWITIQDQIFAGIILEALGDPDKKSILNSVLNRPLIVAEILKICKIPQTSGYRKINSLIKDGLLIQSGQHMTADRKKVSRYETIFKNIKLEMEKNSFTIKAQIKEEILMHSSILRTVNL